MSGFDWTKVKCRLCGKGFPASKIKATKPADESIKSAGWARDGEYYECAKCTGGLFSDPPEPRDWKEADF